ncbi:hypothetical protein [Streptomyces clavuligerus]|uniref:Integral membrane protein n=1 Tax=Streptomyces clavuligerus TaxID=1901 RepID=B5H263_STRCL|nr:hypothetical protein [Streptomyces clavuligerus]ANW21054.1 hypothetical protein BB341_24000 [Streptomyces clavuligerus]AXU15673.1 hypothetical protein D1794_24935 [Streptomyces clavuligerus]EDY52659.1 integral membrane protein [Streptomyces clavuligerus]EFG05865.1 integral membrane protein [Streptomyces clavuligerus]MBY6305792.1 hypothetical protein [Streptomyces clavuligerus]
MSGTETGTGTGSGGGTGTETGGGRSRLVTGPGMLLVWLYSVMSVGAVSRSVYAIVTDFDSAPLAHSLSAVAAAVYAFITYTLVRGGETARRAALVCCAAELAGVVIVGTWTVLEPSAFPDSTVWSEYGMGYLLIPVLLPVTGMLWLRRSRSHAG